MIVIGMDIGLWQIPTGYFLPRKNLKFRSPYRTGNDLAYYVFSDGSVGTGYVVPGGDFSGDHYGVDWDSCGRSSPDVDYGDGVCCVFLDGNVYHDIWNFGYSYGNKNS